MTSNLSDYLGGDKNADPNTIAQRDSSGCLTASDPVSSTNLATKNYVDTNAANAVAAATSSPTASTLMKRDASGRAQVNDPSASKDIANVEWVNAQIAASTPTASSNWQVFAESGYSTTTNYSTGTVSVSGATVTGSGTSWSGLPSSGLHIGFGSTDPTKISTWYPVSSIGSDTSLTITGNLSLGSSTPYVITAVGTNSWQFGGLFGEFTNTVTKLNPVGANTIGNAETAPTVTVNGATGSTTYNYAVVARDSLGNASPMSLFKQITNGNAQLTTTNYNAISWSAVTGADYYDVYRMSERYNNITVGTNPGPMLLVGSTLYVCNTGTNTVSVVNTVTNTVTTTITVGSAPSGLALAGSNLYVVNKTSGTVSVINTGSNTVTTTLTVGTSPNAIATNGTYVYVVNGGGTTVSVITVSSNTVTSTVTTGSGGRQVLITANYAAVLALNGSTSTTYFISTSSNTVSASTVQGNMGSVIQMCNNPANDTIFLVGASGGSSDNIYQVTTSGSTVFQTMTQMNSLNAINITPDGTRLFVAGKYTPNNAGYMCIGIVTASTGAICTQKQIPMSNTSSNCIVFDSTGQNVYFTGGQILMTLNTNTLFFTYPSNVSASWVSTGQNGTQSIVVANTGVYGTWGSATLSCNSLPGKIASTTSTSYNDQSFSTGDATYPPSGAQRSITLSASSPSTQLLDCTNGNLLITLPDATTCAGKEFMFPRTDATTNYARVFPQNSTQDVGGLLGWTIWNKANTLWIKSDGATWRWVNRPAAGQWGVAQLPTKKTRNCTDMMLQQFAVLCNDQQIYSWGVNTHYNLCHFTGNGTIDQTSPVIFDPYNPPTKGTYIVDWVNTGDNLFVLMSDGQAFSGGSSAGGQLGNNGTTAAAYLQKVVSLSGTDQTGFVKLWAYGFGSLAANDGMVFWLPVNGNTYVGGNGAYGFLGTGSSSNVLQYTGGAVVHPVEIKIATGASSSTNATQAAICDAFGNLWFAGYNPNGNFGNGTTNGAVALTYTQVTISGAKPIMHVYPGGGYNGSSGYNVYSAVLDTAGNLYTAGIGTFGQLGNGSTSQVNTFAKVTALTNPIVDLKQGGGFAANYIALDNQGNIWTWGYNTTNCLFQASTASPISTPVQITTLPNPVLMIDNYISAGTTNAPFMICWDGSVLRLASNTPSSYNMQIGFADPLFASGAFTIPLPGSVGSGEETITDIMIAVTTTVARIMILTDQGNLYGGGDNTNQILFGGVGTNSNPVQYGPVRIKVA